MGQRPADRVVLIRIPRAYRPGMSDEALYEATRKWWRIDPRRDPEFAFSVVGGRVLAVYRIDDWERHPESGRRAFRGVRDEDMDRRYIGMDVSEHFRPGNQNPIRYVEL